MQIGEVIFDDRKSTSGEALFLWRRLVTWTSKKKSCTSQSIAEAKYVTAAINCTNIIWITHLLKGMKEEINKPVLLYCDNRSAINISKNPVMHAKTKHIAIKYHYVRELVEDKQVKMEYINSKEQIADIFTKLLPKDAFKYLRVNLGVKPLSQAIWAIEKSPYIKSVDCWNNINWCRGY